MKRFLAIFLIASTGWADLAILNTFNSGELSPHMNARIDFEKYKSGLRTLENFTVLTYGGARKRPGTEYISNTKSNSVARLAPFSVGVDQTYVMELGDEYIRFYSNGAQIQDTNSVPVEVETPYSADDVFEVQLAQFADTIYMVHPDHPVQKLQRTSTAPTFTIEEVDWAYPPVMDENFTDITLTPSAITGSVTITASDSLFTTNHVDSDWVIRSPYENSQAELDLSSAVNTTSTVIRIEGDWNLRTVGTGYDGILKLQISEDGGSTWGTFREYESSTTSGAERNYDRSGTESEIGVQYRMIFESNGSGDGVAYLKAESAYLNGWVTITNYVSSTQVQAVVQSDLGSTEATDQWYEGAFSDERGYPRTVEFYENRLWFGGTDYMVNTLWGSETANYERFQTGTYDDSSLRLSINSDNIIEWLLGRGQLFIGTLGDEWILSGGDSSTPITPSTVVARRQTGFGSKNGLDALIASDSILYLQRQGRKLREFEYSLESDAYKSIDVTMLAEHITDGGIVQIDDQQQPEPTIWCVRSDGQLLSMAYSKAQNVAGWSRHITDGEFESVAVIPTDGEDRVYVVVNRDGGRYVEWFKPFEFDSQDDAWFVDSGLEYDGVDALTVTNATVVVDYLETESIDAVPSALRGSLSWHDTGFDINGSNIYEDPSETYSFWKNGTNWTITLSSDISNNPSNFFKQRNYPEAMFVTGAGTSEVNDIYEYTTSFIGFNIPPDRNYGWIADLYVIYYKNNDWRLGGMNQVEDYSANNNTNALPPKTGWIDEEGDLPAPELSYTVSRDELLGEGSFDGTITFTEATNANAGIILNVNNSFSDGDLVLLSDDGGLDIVSFGDGIFLCTNCTSTNVLLKYKGGTDVFARGSLTNSITITEVKNTFTNVSHLAGQEVNIFADGGAQPPATVSTNGVLVTSDYHNHVVAGLPYTAKLSPMYIDTVSQAGISYAKTKNPYKVHFRVKDSGRFYYGSSTNALYPVSVRSPSLPVGQPVPFFSGDPATKMIEIAPSTAPEFWVTSPEPLPLELLSITLFTKISEYE